MALSVPLSRFPPRVGGGSAFYVGPMTLQDWSNLAQVIGALVVVISLFYVGFQIKRNTSAVRSATAQAIHTNYGDW